MSVEVLIYDTTLRSPWLRHEVPVSIGDPFLYAEVSGRRVVVTNALEDGRLQHEAPELERLLVDALGRDELIAAGLSVQDVGVELCVRAARHLGIADAVVPPDFPIGVADGLREAGIRLRPDESFFAERRRRKTAAELAGIRRAATAALAGMRAAAEMLRSAEVAGDALLTAGRPLTSEAVRASIREACARAGAQCPPDIMVKPMGPAARIGHYAGFGPLPAHTPILIDLWPQDDESGCWADMTRTFLIGNVPDAIAELYAIVLEAHERTCSSVRPGITGRALYDLACDVFEGAGYPTQRTNAPGETLRSGFYHGLGHGVGLEVHEAPGLGRMGGEELVAGDVVALEPGTVDLELGGARVEDLLVVTEAGAENLTASFPLELRLAG